MSEGFTQKEMLVRIMDKLDDMEKRIYATHEIAKKTNGKVKLHQKLIFFLFGAILTIIGFLIKYKGG